MRATTHLAHAQAVLQQAYRDDIARRRGELLLTADQAVELRQDIAHGQAVVSECARQLQRTTAANDEASAPSAA